MSAGDYLCFLTTQMNDKAASVSVKGLTSIVAGNLDEGQGSLIRISFNCANQLDVLAVVNTVNITVIIREKIFCLNNLCKTLNNESVPLSFLSSLHSTATLKRKRHSFLFLQLSIVSLSCPLNQDLIECGFTCLCVCVLDIAHVHMCACF